MKAESERSIPKSDFTEVQVDDDWKRRIVGGHPEAQKATTDLKALTWRQ